ncbi:bile acid:sodium symporter family protein [Bacillus sp. JCM 19041]|uniref:bile acid:sodium symporter family protein n=1 Tax=Bacillus sp. JCM 19041 TaxID=1460637 RepID=UPI0006D19D85
MVNQFLQKWLPLLTPVAVLIGVLGVGVLEVFVFLVPWIFACMSFANSITIHPKEIIEITRFPLSFALVLIGLHVLMPILAFSIGWLVFPNDLLTRTGLLLAFSIPTGIVSLMWISIYGGNRTLALCVILVNTLLAPILIPVTLTVFLGTEIELNTSGMLWGIFWMVVAPSVAALIIHAFKPRWVEPIHTIGAPLTKVGLLAVICLNSSVAAPYFRALDLHLTVIIITVLFLAITGYFLGLVLGSVGQVNEAEKMSMMLLCGMRNIGVGAAIAVVYFPPIATLPVIVGTLFQQILAAYFGKWRVKRIARSIHA